MAALDLGDLYRTHRKNYARAYELYVLAQGISPRDKGSYLKLQDICKKLGRPEEAEVWKARWKEHR
jgi:hypothetical protein